MPAPILKTGFTRVFTIEGGAGPANQPQYQGRAMAGAVEWSLGDVSKVEAPSANGYDRFDTISLIQGQRDLPTLPLSFRKNLGLSAILKLVKKGCAVDIQVHAGSCGTPTDFDGGWKDGAIIVLQGAIPTSYSTEPLGALSSDDRAPVMEDTDWSGLDYYEIGPVTVGTQADSQVTDEITDVAICDSVQCAECGVSSDGCQVAFALQAESSGSAGIGPALFYTKDGGSTWTKSIITSAALTDVARKVDCMGTYVIVTVGGAAGGHHYIPTASILAGLGGWTKVSSGYTVAAGAPGDIFVVSASLAFIAGDGGYIYKLTSPTGSPTTLQSGGLTAQALASIHGLDDGLNVVAAGAANVILASQNGGATWRLVTGPAPAVNLNGIWQRSSLEWHVITNGGKLFYTRDAGGTWVEKTFDGSGVGICYSISYANASVGYMTHSTNAATPAGRIFRTVNGGFSWYLLPETGGNIPTNRRINAIVACKDDCNVAFGGGLLDANDGLIVKVA